MFDLYYWRQIDQFLYKMSLSNVEEVGTSLPDVQSREMQILEEENDPNVQQNFDTSSCSVCNKHCTKNEVFH